MQNFSASYVGKINVNLAEAVAMQLTEQCDETFFVAIIAVASSG
jgi:hypothetical protein